MSSFAQIHKDFTVTQADSLITANISNPDFVILDVRTPGEFGGGHIQNAVNINYLSPTFGAQLDVLDKNFIYLVYCQGGSRSPKAMDTMQVKGFIETYNMLGGINAWTGAGHQVVTGVSVFSDISTTALIYPNPATDKVKIEGNLGGTISLFDITGQLVLTQENTDGFIHIGALEKGCYIVEIPMDKRVVRTKLFKE